MAGFGFKLHKAQNEPQEIVRCIHLVGDSVALGKGDPVKLVTGSINIGSGGTVQAVARCASGSAVYGVVVGCEEHTAVTGFSLNQTYCPASTAMYILVRPVSAGDLFAVLEDASGGNIATTNVGKNTNFTAANCSTTTGMSAYTIQSANVATTNTLDVCIRGFSPNVDNVPGASSGASTSAAILLVSFNNLQNINQATGV